MSAVLHPPTSQLSDPDLQAVPVALAPAAQRAREIAVHTGTPLVVTRDGRLIEEVVQPVPPKPTDGVSSKH